MATLEVVLKAQIAELEKALKKARSDLKETGEEAEKAGDKIGNGGKKGFDNLKKSTVNTTPALLEFNRTIQDAPFGIQGVANNIQQLTANFGDLSKRTGGTVNALKAMASGLAGPQGILLGVSAVTSLLVVYGDELFRSSSLTLKLAEATGKFIGEAQTEAVALQNLVSIASDENTAKSARLAALDRINDKYGDYLGNLSLEEIATDGVRESVELLTKSLLKQAQVRGIESAISDIYADAGEDLAELLLNQRAARGAVSAELERLRKEVGAFKNVEFTGNLQQDVNKLTAIVNSAGGQGSSLLRNLGFNVSELNQASAAVREFRNDLDAEISPFKDILRDFSVDSFIAENNKLAELDGVTVLGDKLKKFKNDFKSLDDIFGINNAVQNSLNKLKPQFEDFNVTLNKFGQITGFALKNTVNVVKPRLAEIEKVLIDFNKSASIIIQDGIVNTFSQIGQGIGNALAEGGNIAEALGKSLLGSLGSILVQLGELAIKTGIGLLAVQTALKTLNPYVAIAAGVALVAIGSLFSSSARNLGGSQNFGGGGASNVSGQGSRGSSFSGSSFQGSGGGFGDGRVVFEIAGQKLLGVLENTRAANSKIGGNIG